jgi:NACalpha-BTF3-like transcription factor
VRACVSAKGLRVVKVTDEECARELAEREKFATHLVDGKSYTALEVDLLVKTLDISAEEAASVLEKADGDLMQALEGDEEDY